MDIGELLAVEVGLGPDDVLAALESPLLHQLSGLLQVVGSCPEEEEGGTVADLLHLDLLQLLEADACVDAALLL